MIMVGGFNKQAFSSFTSRATPIEDVGSKKIVAAVDVYESDFGRLKVVPNRFQRARDVLVLQMEMWAVAYLNGRRMVSIPLARTGDSERRQMLSEYSRVARNEKSSGGVFRQHHIVTSSVLPSPLWGGSPAEAQRRRAGWGWCGDPLTDPHPQPLPTR